MSKKKRNKKTNYKVEDKVVKWEDLAETSENIRKTLADLNMKMMEISNRFKEQIENNPNLSKTLQGIVLTLNDLTEQYVTVKASHSKGAPDQPVFFTGDVNPEDDKQMELYMNATIAYAGLANQLQVVGHTSVAALLTELQAELEKQKGAEGGKDN